MKGQRSAWKLPYISPYFLSYSFFKSKKFFTHKRNSCIAPHFLDKRMAVHSGNKWKSYLIRTNKMVGKKLGEFSMTKLFGSAIAQSMALKQKRKKEDKKKKKK